MMEEYAKAVAAEVGRIICQPVGLLVVDTMPWRFEFCGRTEYVSLTPFDNNEPVRDKALRIARAFWMAALADQQAKCCGECRTTTTRLYGLWDVRSCSAACDRALDDALDGADDARDGCGDGDCHRCGSQKP